MITFSCYLQYFYFYMYMLSSVSILVILILGSCDKLSNDEQYKDQKTVTFIRIGAVGEFSGRYTYQRQLRKFRTLNATFELSF